MSINNKKYECHESKTKHPGKYKINRKSNKTNHKSYRMRYRKHSIMKKIYKYAPTKKDQEVLRAWRSEGLVARKELRAKERSRRTPKINKHVAK